jgi:F-type H+-transporting ATPase subunit gamma
MPPLREVKNRIKSVKNISQITRALEAVSASRVRRAQARVLASRAYAQKAWEILLNVQKASAGQASHPLLMEREKINKIMIVLITSDRGLAGSYNTNIIRVAQRFGERMGKPIEYVTVGRKGRDTLFREGANIVAEFSDLPAELRISDVAPISRLAIDAFFGGEVDEVLIAYTDFVNMLAQRPVVLPWLPLTTHTEANRVAGEFIKDMPQITEGALSYDYEPSAAALLDEIVPRFTELQLYQALLEAQASEHAARMAAMRNATDNATQLVADLTLDYNKARQAAITNEILDIVGGANALQQSIDNAADAILAIGAKQALVDAAGSYHQAPTRTPASDAKRGPATATASSPVAIAEPPVAVATPTQTATPAAPSGSKGPKGKKAVKDDGSHDLTIVEGIGAKMAAALVAAGINTFEKLAAATDVELRQAIEKAGMSFSPSLATWSTQAEYAARGDWAGLQQYQSQLSGGRKNPS